MQSWNTPGIVLAHVFRHMHIIVATPESRDRCLRIWCVRSFATMTDKERDVECGL